MKYKVLSVCSIALSALLVTGAAQATFQNWQSDVFEEKPRGEKVRHQPDNEALELEREIREDPSIDEGAYYEAIAPKDMERDHDYLLHDHPLQEKPLPTKGVE